MGLWFYARILHNGLFARRIQMQTCESIISKVCVQLMHFPFLHASLFCTLLLKIMTGYGLALLSSYFLAVVGRTSFLISAIFAILLVCFTVYASLNFLLLLRNFARTCKCGYQIKNDSRFLMPACVALFSAVLVLFEIFLCAWITHSGMISNYGGPFLSSVMLGAISFLSPAAILGFVLMSGRIATFESNNKSIHRC